MQNDSPDQDRKLEELALKADLQRVQAEEQIQNLRARPKNIATRAAQKIVKSNPLLIYRVGKVVLPAGLALSRTVLKRFGPAGLVGTAVITIATYGITKGIYNEKLRRQQKDNVEITEIEEIDIDTLDE